MTRIIRNFKIELNSSDNVRELLQEIYNLADEQIKQSQDEINKLSSATDLPSEAMDAKAKYSKAINDYLAIKDKAISKKLEISKLLSDIMTHNGDVKATLEETKVNQTFSINSLRSMIDETIEKKEESGRPQIISLKKP